MLKVVNIKANGVLEINLGGFAITTSVDDPLLPPSVFAAASSAFEDMAAQGVSEIHMEQDTFRTFTHTVKGGLVGAQTDITNPAFSIIVSAKADLEQVYAPQPQ
jgi:hypothetical protein